MRAVRTIMPGSLLPHAWDAVLRSGRSLGPGRRKAQAVACKHSAWPGGHTCSCNAGPCPGGGSPRVLWPALAPALEHDSCTAANARPCTYEQTCTDLLRHPVRSPLCHERERSAPHESLKVRGRHPPHSCPAAAHARSRHTRGTSEKERRPPKQAADSRAFAHAFQSQPVHARRPRRPAMPGHTTSMMAARTHAKAAHGSGHPAPVTAGRPSQVARLARCERRKQQARQPPPARSRRAGARAAHARTGASQGRMRAQAAAPAPPARRRGNAAAPRRSAAASQRDVQGHGVVQQEAAAHAPAGGRRGRRVADVAHAHRQRAAGVLAVGPGAGAGVGRLRARGAAGVAAAGRRIVRSPLRQPRLAALLALPARARRRDRRGLGPSGSPERCTKGRQGRAARLERSAPLRTRAASS